ncbi:MAG: hypothetical protein ACFFDN_50190, partial [Candidatus Hodarchaeota archaeon]
MNDYFVACTFGLPDNWPKNYPIFYDKGIQLCTHGENTQNIKLPYKEIVNKIRRKCTPKELDILEIASFIYLADRVCRRGHDLDWVRRIHFIIPVRDIYFWEDHKNLLIEIVSYLTGDNI